jgi:putative sigma-54 modulation protein
MRLELTGRHTDITPAIRRLVDKKLARLGRLLNDSAVSAQVVLTHEKRDRRADVTVHARGENFLHGVGASAKWETSLSMAVDKIVQQATKVKGKWDDRKRKGSRSGGSVRTQGERTAAASARAPEAAAPRPRARMPRVLKASRQAIRIMSVADATREVQGNGDGVLVFRDIDRSQVSVLVRRPNGELTLVETE